ncbi:alpha/beta fold hydrolase [Prescottella equi]|uniref:alpha/beta fold hydrolase n=1 Tax=Rhodococcus hoagii TaxID=43767 RepID=UPI001EEB33C9|nr:alpha/beta fold hydrolase [Prescottella equi]
MHYVTEGEGPLVVLLHGFPHTWFSWRHQIGALADAGYRVVAPDLRGMGQTDVPDRLEDYRVDNVVADICGLLDHLGHDSAVFSGLDYGQFVAYDIAIEHPERVRGVIGLQNPFYASLRPTSQRGRKGARARAFQPHVVLPRRPGRGPPRSRRESTRDPHEDLPRPLRRR